MSTRPVLAPAAVVVLSVASALYAGDPLGNAEAVFEGARAKDQLIGVLNSTASELHVTFTAPAGSTLGLTASPDTTVSFGAAGLAFRLCAPDGSDLAVAGGPSDKSKPEKDLVKWKKVPLEAFGTYTLVADAQTAGGMLVKLSIAEKTAKVDESTEAPLAVGETATVEFDGRTGDTLKFQLTAAGKGSKFAGELFQILRPDGSALPDPVAAAKGKVLLDANGRHKLLFSNVGKDAGGWRAKLTVKPPKAAKRKGLVSARQTGLVPKVKSIDPTSAYNKDTALRVTMTGTDLQPGMDVRLVRKNRQDILAEDVEWISPTEVRFLVDLDTTPTEGKDSIGTWFVSVWNAPVYGTPDDRATLDRTSPLVHEAKKLKSLSAGSVKLPDGVEDGTEVWQLVFNADFQTDLDRMGLGSDVPSLRTSVNTIVRNYVLAYLRDLMLANETNGAVQGAAVPVSFVMDDVTAVAGKPGVDYNRIEIGGAFQDGDPTAALEPLEWGFAERDVGNTRRDDLMVADADGNRLGLGARLAVLDARNGNNQASSPWRLAMEPLRLRPLSAFDVRYFTGQFNPNSPSDIARYAEIVEQLERAAREIAAIVAHHIGRAMGLATAGDGPMAAPSFSGNMWPLRTSTAFSDSDLALLRLAAAPHALPGSSSRLKVSFFPVIDRQPELIPAAETGKPYEIKWEFVGGRCNAVPSDYRVGWARGSEIPTGLVLTFEGLAGTPPVCFNGQCTDVGSINCGVAEFAILVDDLPRNSGSFLYHRIKILPTVSLLPAQLQVQAQQCRDAVIQAP